MSAVLFESLPLGDWTLDLTARQGREGETLYFGVLTGLGGAVGARPRQKVLLPSRQALLAFWEPLARGLPSPEELRTQILGEGA